MAKKKPKIEPAVRADIFLVEYGYQLDLYIDGELEGSQCRDFSGNYKIKELAITACAVIVNAIEKLEESHALVAKKMFTNVKQKGKTKQTKGTTLRQKGVIPPPKSNKLR